MVTNISNFEALKPTKTYKKIQKAKQYFKDKIRAAAPIMDAESAVIFEEAEISLEIIKSIEDSFLKGE